MPAPMGAVRPDITERDGVLRVDFSPSFNLRRLTNALVLAAVAIVLSQRAGTGSARELFYGVAAGAALLGAAAAMLRREFLVASKDSITIGSKVGPFSNGRDYLTSEVRNLREHRDTLTFDVPDGPVHFARGLTPEHLSKLRARIEAVAPQTAQPRTIFGLE